MDKLIILLAVPILYVLVMRLVFRNTICWKETAIQAGSSVFLVTAIYSIMLSSKTADYELWHGEITGKVHKKDSYEESYDCFCVSDGDGGQICQTCWKTIYRVRWYLESTLGTIPIKRKESESKSVWNTPSPDAYIQAAVGEHCAQTRKFTNYVLAAGNSLFNKSDYAHQTKWVLPRYPGIHNVYRLNSVLDANSGIDSEILKEWNQRLAHRLKTLGPSKQVNVIVVFTGDPDPRYRYALESAWVGGKKNDLVVVVGLNEGSDIQWADVFAFGLSAGNQMLATVLRDDLMALKNLSKITPELGVDMIASSVDKHFNRKEMKDFTYLKDEITLSIGQLLFLMLFQLAVNIALTFYFIKNDPFKNGI